MSTFLFVGLNIFLQERHGENKSCMTNSCMATAPLTLSVKYTHKHTHYNIVKLCFWLIVNSSFIDY